jgi:sarcosine oxidase
MSEWDVIVIGVGGMGSSTVYELARRGLRVLGLERFDVPHEFGSSHGVTRIIRLGYWEHPSYVPLLQRAFERWRDIEFLAGERLLIATGSIDAGSESSKTFSGSRLACEQHQLPYEVYDGRALGMRFPGYNLPPDMYAVYQAKGGFVMSERAIVAYVFQALGLGAEIHAREQVLEWTPRGGGVEVRTDRGVYRAGRLVLTAGAWNGKLDTALSSLLVPERQVVLWTQPRPARDFSIDTFPVFNLEAPEGRFYGLPEHYIPGFKIGRYHHLGERVEPDDIRRPPDAEDEALLRQAIVRYFPGADGPVLSMRTCLFTNSPDEHFIIGAHPAEPRVIVAAGFSGHGFKFCSVVGEILADLAMGAAPAFDIEFLSPQRFARHAGH